MAEVERIEGNAGDYDVTVKVSPRYVREDACTLCDDCAKACPSERKDEFNFGLSKTKAVYLPHNMAFPASYVIDRDACPSGCTACAEACKYGAVDLDQKEERHTFKAASVVAATGWAPYDASKIDNLGFGKYENIVTNVIMERLAAPNGPTGGKIIRPSDGHEIRSVVFVQCAGSRDENHLPYCSAVCCAASLKQATYVREQYPDAQITIFYIDIRTPARLEDFYNKVTDDENLELIKGKVAMVEEDPATRDILVTAEDALNGRKITRAANLLVLATGIVPQTEGLPEGFELDEFRFVANAGGKKGLIGAGCVRRPEEVSATVQDATGAALKAFQCVRRANHG